MTWFYKWRITPQRRTFVTKLKTTIYLEPVLEKHFNLTNYLRNRIEIIWVTTHFCALALKDFVKIDCRKTRNRKFFTNIQKLLKSTTTNEKPWKNNIK